MTDVASRPALTRTRAALAAPRPVTGDAAPDPGAVQGVYGGATSPYVDRLLRAVNTFGSTGLTFPKIAKMRRHYQVAAALKVQQLPLQRADWIIECDDDDVRAHAEEAYRRIAFDVHRTMARALPYGYSPNTITWDLDSALGWVVTGIRDLDAQSCTALVDERGTFAGFTQRILGSDEDPIDREYALWLVEAMEEGNLYGRSILEAALDPWQDAAAIRAFRLRALERFGEPVVIARAPSGSTIINQDEITAGALQDPPVTVAPKYADNLDAAVEIGRNLRHHSVAGLPSDLLFGADGKPTGFAWSLEYLEARASSDTAFRDALEDSDRAMMRGIFVPDLILGNGNGVGSYALGQTHRGVWETSVEGRLDDYSRQITAQLLDPIRVLNFGERAPATRLVFSPLADELKDELWTIASGLIDTGKITPDAEAIASRLGIPTAAPEEQQADPASSPFAQVGLPALVTAGIITEDEARTLIGLDGPAPGAPDPQVPASSMARAVDDPAARADLRERLGLSRETPAAPVATLAASSAGNVDGLPSWRLPQAYDPPAAFARPLNAREERVGFLALERALNTAEARTIDRLVEILETERARVLRQLEAVLRKGTRAEVLAALGTIELKGKGAAATAWSDLMGEVWSVAIANLADEVGTYAAQLPDAIGPEGRALIRTYAAANADRVFAAVTTQVQLELLNAYTSAVSPAGMSAVVSDLFEQLETGEGKPVRLTTRMLSAKSLNVARADTIQRGGVPLRGAQYSALLDRRTCDLCRELDEQVIAVTHTDLARFTPPVHHNCRCVWVWITEEELDFTPTWSTPAPSKVDRFGGLVY